MTNEQILEKAIQKAIEGGYKGYALADCELGFGGDDEMVFITRRNGNHHLYMLFAEQIIFNHDFAKALWGEEKVYNVGNGEPLGEGYHALLYPLIPRWQFHLKEMVISEDPIKYLGDHM